MKRMIPAVFSVLLLSLVGSHAAEEWSPIECCDANGGPGTPAPATSTSTASNSPKPADPNFLASPGNIGPNAFFFMWHVDDARIVGDQINIDLSYRNTLDMWKDTTHAGVLRVEIPFGNLASVEFSQVLEKWKLNDDGMAALQPRTRSGLSLGDFIAKVKFNILTEKPGRPSITLKGTIKSASGGFEDRRSTDSAGYVISALFAKDLITASGALRKMRVMSEFGFFAWDTSAHGQDDAFVYGGALEFEFRNGYFAKVGLNGYTGWQKDGDTPMSLFVEGTKVFSRTMTAFGSFDYALNKASTSPYTAALGLRVTLVNPWRRSR